MYEVVWWVLIIAALVWLVGVVLLTVLMIKNYAKGDRFGFREIVATILWPIECGKMIIVILAITCDDKIG